MADYVEQWLKQRLEELEKSRCLVSEYLGENLARGLACMANRGSAHAMAMFALIQATPQEEWKEILVHLRQHLELPAAGEEQAEEQAERIAQAITGGF